MKRYKMENNPTKVIENMNDFNDESKSFTSRHRKFLLITLMVCNYWMGISYVLLIPLFPEEMKKRGNRPFLYEAVLSIYQIIVIFFSPFVGKIPIRPNVLAYGSLLLSGSAAFLMAGISYLPWNIAFYVLAFLSRILDGIGSTIYSAFIYSLIVTIFPRNRAIIIAMMETLNGLGMLTGTVFGALFSEIGGYSLPYLILGTFLFMSSLLARKYLPCEREDLKTEFIELKKLIFHHHFLMNLLICFSAYFAIGFNSNTLEESLNRDNVRVLTGVAVSITCCGFFLVGPPPFIPFRSSLWLVIVSEILLDAGIGGQIICAFFDGIQGTMKRGFPDDVHTYSAIFGNLLSATATGCLIGPFLGQIFSRYYGYATATFFAAVVEFVITTIVWAYILWKRISNGDQEERISLLSSKS
ncbi:MFS-type transporter SLC18B1-like isoform X3 [Centruroides sculpturatus]|uniref:MFS-type transporter SLC18B1-like isoform X3 n=1 Tax=Centruroides sculpturatus TaxID=218467 RepID=UPI000C6DB0E4|nr:MFS-type transporter SLC18B1-like isoform X3 [Centruroides sculpturatus]